MEKITLSIPEGYKKRLKYHIKESDTPSMSEWLRKMIDKEIPQ